ncbi:dirigent protein 1-like [Salvia miltiorrhiza]|uniref:dirigent protein 1-like n=1 Tax=Salvia miltiorrhiza TaxID=226208 RepID=UPI0025ABA9BC|nr:dirigent protein 1-like [Salvia miltiorrhiza]
MAKLIINHAILLIFSLFITTQIHVNARDLDDERDDELEANYLCLKNEKLTKIHFYAQDFAGGPNSTVFEMARTNITGDPLLSFGKLLVVDDLLTAGPGLDSKKVGRSQGIVTSADMNTPATALNFNVVFTSGKYNGSTLSIAGRNLVSATVRRLAVIGGTGVFRFARGYAALTSYSFEVGKDLQTYYVVIEYNVYTTFCPM